MVTQQTAERYVLVAAGIVIVALTAGGFWLSYAHLAEVAGQHGLGDSPARRWAWPATLDAFIVAGELLMLRAGLRRAPDWWAIALTATGSIGSIVLNVAGVSGTGDADTVPLLDYVVAAVPPTAALLAFGVLMRQIHQLVAEPASTPAATAEAVRGAGMEADPTADPVTPDPSSGPVHQALGMARSAEGLADQDTPTPTDVATETGTPDTWTAETTEADSRGGGKKTGRPAGATMEQLLAVARPAVAQHRLSRSVVEQAVRSAGLPLGSTRFTQLMRQLRAEEARSQVRKPPAVE